MILAGAAIMANMVCSCNEKEKGEKKGKPRVGKSRPAGREEGGAGGGGGAVVVGYAVR